VRLRSTNDRTGALSVAIHFNLPLPLDSRHRFSLHSVYCRLSRELAARCAPALAAKAVFDSYHTSPDTSVRRVAAYADSVFQYVARRGDSIAKVLGHIGETESVELEASTRRDFTNVLMSMEAAFGALGLARPALEARAGACTDGAAAANSRSTTRPSCIRMTSETDATTSEAK